MGHFIQNYEKDNELDTCASLYGEEERDLGKKIIGKDYLENIQDRNQSKT